VENCDEEPTSGCAAVGTGGSVWLAAGQDAKKDDKDPPARVRGTLPPHYKQLGLSDDQKQAVYRVRNKYTAQIDDLKAKIHALQDAEKMELEKLLTDAQKARLKELLLGETKPTDPDKKPTDTKPPDKEKKDGK